MSMKEKAEALGIKVDGRWSEERIQAEIDAVSSPGYGGVNNSQANPFEDAEFASAHAAKIWAGQSNTLSLLERVGRIRMALKDKGFDDFDNLVLPTTEDYRKYL